MSHVLLENIQTGEVVQAALSGQLPAGFKIKGVVIDEAKHPDHQWTSRLAVWSQKLGLPTADLLDAARWLLDKDCPYCQLGTQVLRRIDELGEEKTTFAINMILQAKKDNDLATLEYVRKWCSESQESPLRS